MWLGYHLIGTAFHIIWNSVPYHLEQHSISSGTRFQLNCTKS